MTSTSVQTNDEQEIRAGIDERVRAVRAKDVDGLMSSYATNVDTFDMVPPLTSKGSNAVRKRLVEWFSSFQTSIDYEISEVTVAVAGDVAFDHHVTRVRGTSTAGNEIDMWFRETVGYRKILGRWTVTHQHSSVPFDMTNGKALLTLRP